MSPPSPKSPYRLMVEGPDDKHTLVHLLKRHGYDWDDATLKRPYVEDVGGVEKLLEKTLLSTALKTHDRLALVFDADLPPYNRWHQLKTCLEQLGIAVPNAPEPGGTLLSGIRPNSRLGIWVMPDNSQPGRIEEFIEKLVPADDTLWPHARTTTTDALNQGAPLRPQDHVKGALHAWLAWQLDPGIPFGVALASKVLGHDSPEAQRFVDWFHRCFS
ncbi:DUF3226 domain-containing protein [Corallococcus exiguus]|uniref:DUF3226 domain-containing protein n=1 Tax=Corallococcus exiguus TaxID=83462 RepID=UPI0014940B51|nr:DUF3226 domain-containing protein [Corallococcus exiguus]